MLRIAGWVFALVAFAFLLYQVSILARVWWWVEHNPYSSAFMQARFETLQEKRGDKARLKHEWVTYDQAGAADLRRPAPDARPRPGACRLSPGTADKEQAALSARRVVLRALSRA